jgi:hypothetical protein
MRTDTWINGAPPEAHWELLWIPRRGKYVAGDTTIVGVDPQEFLAELTAALERQGRAVTTPSELLYHGIDADDQLLHFLARFVSSSIDQARYRYQVGLVDDSGGRQRDEFGNLVH